jgi:hypothetical protein
MVYVVAYWNSLWVQYFYEAADSVETWGPKQDGLAVVDAAASFITSSCNVRFNALHFGITWRGVFYGCTQTSRNFTGGSTYKACSVSVSFKINTRSLWNAKNKQ